MNRLTRKRQAVVMGLALVVAFGTPLPVLAQESAPVAFHLKYARAKNACQLLTELLGASEEFRCLSDGNRRIFVVGTEKQLEVVKTTLKILDSPPAEDSAFKMFALLNMDAQDALGVLGSLNLAVEIAVDHRTNTLIVKGPDAELAVIEALLTRLDESARQPTAETKATGNYRVDLVWLMEGPSNASVALREPVRHAGEAVAELERQGFEKVGQAGQASVSASEGADFEVSSKGSLGWLTTQGELNTVANGKLELELTIVLRKDDVQLITLSTEITTEPGHDVVLGVAGAVLDNTERRSAFVVRVSK